MVYGRNVRTPLEVMYEGWRGQVGDGLNVVDWVEELGDRLEAVRDIAVKNGLTESSQRKKYYDKGTVERSFEEGDKALCRIPGLVAKLEDSWEGPYDIVQSVSAVNYLIKPCDSTKKARVVHVNILKKFQEKELEVCVLTVIAEDSGLEESLATLQDEKCDGYKELELLGMLS